MKIIMRVVGLLLILNLPVQFIIAPNAIAWGVLSALVGAALLMVRLYRPAPLRTRRKLRHGYGRGRA